MIYLLRLSPHNEDFVLHRYAVNPRDIEALAIEAARRRDIADDENTIRAIVSHDLKTVTIHYDDGDRTQFFVTAIPAAEPEVATDHFDDLWSARWER